jgi:SAM-dependent methyltransferase
MGSSRESTELSAENQTNQTRFVSVRSPETDPHLDGSYFKKHPTWHIEFSAWKAETIYDLLQRKSISPKTIGEVGCGAGEVLRLLQQKLPVDTRFWGWDIAPPAIDLAKKNENDRLRFAVADFGAIETPQLDLLLALEVVDHIEDYFGFLRMLKTRADLKLFSFSLDISAQSALRSGELLRRRKVHTHLHHFSKDTALSALEHTGFEILDAFYPPLLKGGSKLARLARPVRRAMFAVAPDLTARMVGGSPLVVLAR